jgi:hypothetical protein
MKTGLEYALHRVHHGENDLAKHLLEISERHRDEHEIYHVTRDLARWSQENLARLADMAENYGVSLSGKASSPGGLHRAVEAIASRTPTRPALMVLLEDLRHLYLMASETSLAWEMLAQHAQAERERDLLELSAACHPQVLRQIRWANTMLKTLAPQALASLD